MQTTHTYQTFTIEELSDKAKEKAYESIREAGWATSYEWWDGVYDQFKRALEIAGIDVDEMYFRGFSSQGDGASFTGSFQYKAGWRDAFLQEFSPENELLEYLDKLAAIQRTWFYKLTGNIKQSGHYCHSMTMDVTTEHADDIYRDVSAIEDDVQDLMRWMADVLYSWLEEECDHLNSDEVLYEFAAANGWEFLESGRLALRYAA